MAKKAFNTTEEAVNLYEDLYQSQVEARGAEYTHGAFFEDLVRGFKNSANKDKEIEALQCGMMEAKDQRTKLEAELSETKESLMDYQQRGEEIYTLLEAHNIISIGDLKNLLSAESQTVTVEVPAQIEGDQLLLTVPEPTLSILLEVCRRLSERFDRAVKPSDVLLDGFIKYNVEQYQEWFYPFTISESEFTEVCGFSHDQLLKWLRKS